ncbi:disulfide bond formation protein B [Pseudomonas sp. 22105]|uniref:disulfide bond formation protein B n=1 Tax=Pseudomonas TaxID=286 RepID=UPI000A1F6D81|nr:MULTISPECIES: disulfide bond formation protein B [Pseudomonas]AWA42129.1 disulfide bond formation protein B [Pseudomonas fluorescens]MBH3403460.1 disulfide bond formation protein B [Pseudomonas glycinae]MDI3401074.1 disulfide bond formation protein B [Pseudomonas sp. V88_4]NKF25572.1 disulfide bond formation protein B [Pseudomonas sp. BG5]
MSLACSRSLFFMAFTAGILALGASYYLEYAIGLVPCSLCLVQRLFMSALTVFCGVAAIHGPQRFGLSMYWITVLLSSLGGMTAAWRQVLLQGDSLQRLAHCTPDPQELFSSLPWLCALMRMFNDTADCTELSWTLFDLSIPEWSLLFFVGMSILAAYQLLRQVWMALQRPLSGQPSHPALVRD